MVLTNKISNKTTKNNEKMVDKVEARRRAVKLWRHHYLNAGEKAKERAMAECDKNIRAAYTKWYKDFWTEVKKNLEHGAP